MTATTDTTAKTIKPSTLFRTMAQASPKGAKALFVAHHADIAPHYTSVKQLANDIEATANAWGLNVIFKSALKHCKKETTIEAVFGRVVDDITIESPKKAPVKKALDFADILGALPTLSRDDLQQLLREASLLSEHGAPTTPAKPAKQAPAPALH